MLRTFPKTQLWLPLLPGSATGMKPTSKSVQVRITALLIRFYFNEKGGEITVLDVEGELLGFYDFGDYKLELKPILQKIR